MVKFTVFGIAQTAGSKQARAIYRNNPATGQRELVTRGPGGPPVIAIRDDNDKSRSWKQEVASAARQVHQGELLRGALLLKVVFYRSRPKGHFGKGKNAARLLPSANLLPEGKPDLLKLTRAIEDALTQVVWVDDAQICEQILSKRWGEPARTEITIAPFIPREG